MLRTAFEAAQRILALATHDAYLEVGTRAWIYYQRKEQELINLPEHDSSDSGSVTRSDEWLQSRISEMAQVWGAHYPMANQVLGEQKTLLAKQRGPDNFLGRSMSEVLKESYERIAAAYDGTVSEDLASIDRATYASLSREAHARMRIEPRMLRVDADGYVEVREAHQDQNKIRLLILGEQLGILGDAILGLEYRAAKRRLEYVETLRQAEGVMSDRRPKDSRPDFGMALLRQGIGQARHSFPGVPISKLALLPDGTLFVNVLMRVNDLMYMATFDFKGQARSSLVGFLSPKHRPLLELQDRSVSAQVIELDKPVVVDLSAGLGPIQNDGLEAFIPLLVINVCLSK